MHWWGMSSSAGHLNTAWSVANELQVIAPNFDVESVKEDIQSALSEEECLEENDPEFHISNLVSSFIFYHPRNDTEYANICKYFCTFCRRWTNLSSPGIKETTSCVVRIVWREILLS